MARRLSLGPGGTTEDPEVTTVDSDWETRDLAAGDGSVWVQVGDTGAVRIDPVTSQVTAEVKRVTGGEIIGGE